MGSKLYLSPASRLAVRPLEAEPLFVFECVLGRASVSPRSPTAMATVHEDIAPPSSVPTTTTTTSDAHDGSDLQEGGDNDDVSVVVMQDLHRFLSSSSATRENPLTNHSLFDQSAMAVPVAAIKTLLGVVQRSRAETMMGLQNELSQAAQIMKERYHAIPKSSVSRSSSIALQSGIELFLKYITRTFLETPNFDECKSLVLERGERFHKLSLAARDRIAATASEFIRPNSTVLTLGWSRVVAAILRHAALTKHFDVYMLEGRRPDGAGLQAAHCYATETSIPVTVVPDAAMAYVMERVDLVLTGADAVVENGGVVNQCGTAALAMCASVVGKPFYVAAESYKFARLYPLNQSDLPMDPPLTTETDSTRTPSEDAALEPALDSSVKVLNPSVDFTPAKYITLLFTDLGVLTPSAVSDELIRLYQ
jgi:translation initiation factor eIF-2B subunit alpha